MRISAACGSGAAAERRKAATSNLVEVQTQEWSRDSKASNDRSMMIIIMAINVDTVVSTKPNQPLAGFQFRKRSFGKTKMLDRSCQYSWFSRWPFLHYDEGKDALSCHTCLLGFRTCVYLTRKCRTLWGRAWASWYRNIMSLMSDVTLASPTKNKFCNQRKLILQA